jgi:TonB family protein
MSIQLSIPKSIEPKPLIITAAVHALLLLVFLLWRFSLPQPQLTLPEMGMEVNLGSSPDGSGDEQPMDMEEAAAEVAVTPGSMAGEEASTPDVERSTDIDAPAIPETAPARIRRPANNTAAQRQGNTATRTPKPVVQPQRPKFVFPGSSGRGGNSASANMPGASEGNTTGAGDRGVAGGTPGAANYTGSPGTGTGGISHSISGRSIVAFPPKEARFREGGRVTVHVTVNRSGNIVNSRIKRSSSPELSQLALRQLQMVRFNKSETAPEEQFGEITFVFKTRQ